MGLDESSRKSGPDRHDAPPAFEDVYDQWFDFVWRSTRRLGVSEDAAEDVVQDVFINVHRALPSFEGRASIKTWLFAITRNVVRAHIRKLPAKHDVVSDEMVDSGPSPEANTRHREGQAILGELLERMDPAKREIFILSELEEMSGPEIAEALDVKLATIYTRIRAAREAFQKLVNRRLALTDNEDTR